MKLLRLILCYMMICCACFIVLPSQSAAEYRTISWTAVTTYTDNTLIEPYKIIMYDIYWHVTPDFLSPSIHPLVIGTTSISYQFDAYIEGIPRQTAVYFSGKTRLNTGEVSDWAAPYTWNVPPYAIPGKPTLDSNSLRK